MIVTVFMLRCYIVMKLYFCLLAYRLTIEAIGALEPRKSALEDDFEEEEEKDEDDQPMDIDVGGHEKVCHFAYALNLITL